MYVPRKSQQWSRNLVLDSAIDHHSTEADLSVTRNKTRSECSGKEVKADLDANVAMEVLERVPMGTPDTRCTRMVITPKRKMGPPGGLSTFPPLLEQVSEKPIT